MKFKKHISFLLAFFLLVSNVGLAVDVHYCGGEIASVKPVFWRTAESQNTVEESCCPPQASSIEDENAGCCKDKVFHIQEKSENVTINSISFQTDFNFLLEESKPIVFAEVPNFESNKISSYYCDANAPPLFKLYHQYIFYA
ncbi:MAG TPA: hypothetical protein VLR29_09715 [Flavobacterium sp.]|nr:hypothetical protein [Flavobacterium sp.]